ncbi:MAG: TadE family protein [Pseudomonadota bacterium]
MEFALVAPTFMLVLMGIFDLSYRAYAISILQGAVQKAGRDSTLEGASGGLGLINATITNQMRAVASSVAMSFDRKSYVSFTRAGQAEEFEDRNDPITGVPNGVRDVGECYFDENGSGTYDSNAGINGQGGARDIVVFSATAVYPRLFPMYGLLGFPQNETITATTVLRNQPFGAQATRPNPRVCI